jgi:serine/threonine protein kinase
MATADPHASTKQAPPRGERRHFDDGAVVGGRYRVLRHVASGGMGAVYEVQDLELSERVALKVVHGNVASDASAMERFRREIQLARRITHANVCRIFDVGFHREDEGHTVPFLTMELLTGETLADAIRRGGRMTPGRASPLIEQMAAGLEAAHRAGVVHRDFKSHNIMLVPEGADVRVVVMDFGLARAVFTSRPRWLISMFFSKRHLTCSMVWEAGPRATSRSDSSSPRLRACVSELHSALDADLDPHEDHASHAALRTHGRWTWDVRRD